MTCAQPPYPTSDHHKAGEHFAHGKDVLHPHVELNADEIDVRYHAQR